MRLFSANLQEDQMVSPKLQRIKKEAGERMIISLSGVSLSQSEEKMLAEVSPCGIIYFKRNVESCDSLSALIRSTGRFDSIRYHAVDEEGGRVRRLPNGDYSLPSMKVLSQFDNEEKLNKIRYLASVLSEIGINMNMAPNLDLRSGEDNSIVGDRSFGEDPSDVVENAALYIRAMKEFNVFPVLKHFPGHGTTSVDSHTQLPVIGKPFSELLESDLVPYMKLADSAGFVMKAHLLLPEISPLPATLAPEWDEILRKRVGFTGISITDDMEMHALDCYSVEQKVSLFLASGTDKFLTCSGDTDLTNQIFEFFVKMFEKL